MDPHDLNCRLAEIETAWTMLYRAHQQQGSAAERARNELVLRYYGAVYRYLLGMLHDPAQAEELTQEFAVRFLRGDFGKADPQRGRFRDFLKTAVRHLVMDYWKRKKKGRESRRLGEDAADTKPGAAGLSEADSDFVRAWRETLLARAWKALAQSEAETGQPYYAVLRSKADQPELRSAQLAAQLVARLGKTFTEAGVRQTLRRARLRFAELLLAEVSESFPSADPKALEQELIGLGLFDYCRHALERDHPG
jgi:RNA polymerase sigma-70 factor (ECF subfamily)